jgi:hypothetical protein
MGASHPFFFSLNFNDEPKIMNMKPIFATRPSEALQLWGDLLATSEKVRAMYRDGLLTYEEKDAMAWGMVAGSAENWLDWTNLVSRCPVYFWTAALATVVKEASISYPLDLTPVPYADPPNIYKAPDIRPSYWPKVPIGCAVFEKPIFHLSFPGGDTNPVSALIWGVGANRNYHTYTITLVGISWHGGSAHVTWFSNCNVGEVENIFDAEPTFQAEREAFVRWVCAAGMFVEQEIIVGEAHVPGRKERRWSGPKSLFQLPLCQVMRLRRVHHAHDGESGEGREWNYQWLVRGHWRKQWFPSRSAHVPVWIAPYVKGPEDKPLKPVLPTVVSVSR